jgi:hypothetical protein
MNERIDWKAIAVARGLGIPAAEVESLAPRLDALEKAFRPLARALTPDQEPAPTFEADRESE